MPVLPQEENTGGNLTDAVAKGSKDSNASTHPIHDGDGQAGVEAFKANPGPVIQDDIGKPESKETLKARAEELNKDK